MHYYKRNLGDYAKKAGRLSMLQHGAYTLLIDACYDREQFPTLDDAIDWAWASSAAEIEAVEFVLRKFFTLEGDRYVQKRIQEEVAEYHIKADTNARIAQERETKRKEKNTDRARSVDESAPEQHEAPPNHEPRTINQEPVVTTPPDGGEPRKRAAATAARPDDVSEPVWQDFQRLRREKRAPLTDTALAGVRREAKKAGVPLEAAIAYCCEAGWQGFNAGWYAERTGGGGHGAATAKRAEPEWRAEQKNLIAEHFPNIAARSARPSQIIDMETQNGHAIRLD